MKPSRPVLWFTAVFAIVPWLLLFRVYYRRFADHTRVAVPPTVVATQQSVFPLSTTNGRYLVDGHAAPFLIHGEAAWSLIVQLTREDAEVYFEDRRRRGINLVIVNLIEHWFADNPPLNVYGAAPFRVAGDFATPDEKYFDYAREVVRLASEKGILVLLCPAYLGGDGGAEGWFQEMRRNGPEKLKLYGRYVGDHFRDFDNVIWLNGGDYTPPAADLSLVAELARGIRATSPRQLQTAHWSPETSALEVNMGIPLDINTTYTYLPSYMKSRLDYDDGSGRAHFLIESKYEYDLLGSSERSLRGQAYYALLTGAAGQVSGNRWIWTFTRPKFWNRPFGRNWRDALDSPMSRSMSFLRLLFDRLPWTSLVPDESYEVQTSGQGSKGSIDFPVLAWQTDGHLAVAYVPTLKGIVINLDKLARPLQASWYDPTSGKFAAISYTSLTGTGEHPFIPPGNNASGDTDWVLILGTKLP